MGAAQGPLCCGNTTCCKKDETKDNADIVRARPMNYPGLDGLASPKATAKSGAPPPATSSGSGCPATAGSKEATSKQEQDTAKEAATGGSPDSQDGARGEEVYEDGSSYNGQLHDGLRHGSGVWTSPTEQYSGQWKHDQRDGQGKQTWQDGRVYEGQFRKGKFHGHGHMEWHMPTGLMIYEGQYVEDLKDGQGKYVWPDNRVYEGQWKKGMRNGEATYTNAAGEKRQGVWKADKVEQWLEEDAAP